MSARLAESGKPFLGGDSVGADDIIFASHASWVLFNAEFGAGTCSRWPSLAQLPAAYRSIATSYRNTPAGRLAVRLYEEHRDMGSVRELMVEGEMVSPPQARAARL